MKTKWISLGLAGMFALSGLAACGENGEDSQSGVGGGLSEQTFAETGINIIENGSSEYKIVIPASYDKYLLSASNELKEFLYESSGVMLETIEDTDLTYDETDKYISLGNTTLFQQSGLEITEDMRETGYYMQTEGNLLLINAKYSFGTLCATYDLLSYLIDFEVYAADEIYYVEKDTVPMLDFDLKYIPTLDIRMMNQKELRENGVYTNRLRMQLTSELWSAFSHTTITSFIKKEKYLASNPEYYGTTGGDQVCYTNEEMREAMVAEMESIIEQYPDSTWIQIGQEDNTNHCQCENCLAAYEKYGNYAGLQLEFTNRCAEDIDAWLAENYPEREMHYAFFAYQDSVEAPAEYNSATEKYEPTSSDFRCRDNVYVMYAPISLDFNKTLDSDENIGLYNGLLAWRDILETVGRGNNIIVWTYSLNAYSLFLPLANFGTQGRQYAQFADAGVTVLYDQCIGQTNQPCLQALRMYTQSKMMYDRTLDYNELVLDFMEHYYGAASGEMLEYYNFYRYYLQYLEEAKGVTVGKIFTRLYNAEYWPDSTVQYMIDILDRALESIKPLEQTDYERYVVLRDRIKREKLTPIYLMFSLHMSSLTQEEKEVYFADMEKYTEQFGIVETAESVWDMTTQIETWRDEIFG